MKLKPPALGAFLRAMKDSFTAFELSEVITQNFGLRYDHVSNIMLPLSEQVIEVHRYFDSRNTSELLVSVLRDARPAVAAFTAASDSLGLTEFSAGGLEALTRPTGAPYQDAVLFRQMVLMAERAVCQVNCNLAGTGTLIGPKLVITNRHVVGGVLAADGMTLTAPLVCVFDKKLDAGGKATPQTTVKVARVLSSSPHAPSDEKAGALTEAPQALDYALLELVEAIDEKPVVEGGEARGYVKIRDDAPAPHEDDGLLVLQHPSDLPMKVDIGSVKQVGETRLRHSVNTKTGSSGAPLFDAGMNLIAIHHAGHLDWPPATLGYNQAIPLGPILAHARAKGVAV